MEHARYFLYPMCNYLKTNLPICNFTDEKTEFGEVGEYDENLTQQGLQSS